VKSLSVYFATAEKVICRAASIACLWARGAACTNDPEPRYSVRPTEVV